jgi:hypothetical protein
MTERDYIKMRRSSTGLRFAAEPDPADEISKAFTDVEL